MLQTNYESLLNSVSDRSHGGVTADFENLSDVITLTPADIISAFKSLKLGKASGVDCLAAEHFLHALDIQYPILSILFTSFITHGYLPADFMKTALVPIIKNKTGATGDKNNYRPIALVTATSKNFEICLLEILEMYLITHDHQFEFKSMRSFDMCIFSAKSIMKYYTEHGSPVFACFLDASKAFFFEKKIYFIQKKQIDKKNTYILCKIYIHIQSILNTKAIKRVRLHLDSNQGRQIAGLVLYH